MARYFSGLMIVLFIGCDASGRIIVKTYDASADAPEDANVCAHLNPGVAPCESIATCPPETAECKWTCPPSPNGFSYCVAAPK